MVIRQLLKYIIDRLEEAGIDNAIFEAHQLVRQVLKLTATELVINHQQPVSAEAEAAVNALVERRLSDEPLQYILGTQEFMSLEFIVTPDVLIPRADTETLVEHVLELTKKSGCMLLDIGTGTGCIPLSIANYNRRAYVRGVDISSAAIEIAEKNRDALRLSDRADFVHLDILTELPPGKYDIVTSNPPYIEHDVIAALDSCVKDYEPHLALDGGSDGLQFYRRIAEIAPMLLNRGGRLVLEIGFNQAAAVTAMLEKDFADITVLKDLCGNDRVVSARLKTE